MLRPLDGGTPRLVGRYRLLATLGSGGMGTVHLARPEGPPGGAADPAGRLVAVKTMRRDLGGDRDFRIRFRREADAARAVRSPYTAALLDADPDAEVPWLATEYVAGPSLHDAVARSGPLQVAAVRALGADLARGLRAVHGARILHRDLKPANVLLGADGPKVIDFGIAQAYDATALTAAGVVVGSPGFMSPEHLTGGSAVTTASDIFCLGALLCFAATGGGPFDDAELAAVVHRIAQGAPDLTGVPAELREVVGWCLRRDPGARPTSDELIRTLDPVAAAAAVRNPAALLARPSGPYPWPDGVRRLIAAHGVAVRQVIEADAYGAGAGGAAGAPDGGVAYGPAGNGGVAAGVPADARPAARGAGAGAGRDAAPAAGAPGPGAAGGGAAGGGERRRTAVRLAVGAVAGLTAGLLAGVLLLPALLDGDASGTGGDDPPSAAARPRVGPVVTDAQDTGARVVDLNTTVRHRDRRPEGWSPWHARLPGRPTACQIGGELLVCGYNGGVEALDIADGSRRWRFRAESRPAEEGGARGFYPVIGGDTVYTADGDGVVGLRLSDGERVTQWPGASGFVPSRAAAADGVVYVAYEGPSGAGTAYSMLFRAYRASDGRRLWEKVHRDVFPQSLELVGDRLVLQGQSHGLSLDTADGEQAGEAPPCVPMLVRDEELYCHDFGSGATRVRDPRTLKERRRVDGEVVAIGADGTVVTRTTDAEGSTFAGVDPATGEARWTMEGTSEQEAIVAAGDRLLRIDPDGLQSFTLADGAQTGEPASYAGWPANGSSVERVPMALAVNGALFLVFEDGTVVSGYLP